jgi:uncharacterized protein (TIGR00288 family)
MAEPLLKNIALLIDADNASAAGIDPVLTVLAELGQVNIRRVYGNWSKPALKTWAGLTNRYGIRPQQQFDLTKGKNATDMAMTIDAMDLLYQGKVDGFGIMSSDSDFTPLVMRLRQDGVVVYGFGGSRAPEAFKTACTRYIDVEQLIRTEKAEEVDPAPATGPATSDYEELIDLLGSAWKAAKRDTDGYASLTEVGNIAGNRSSFDVRNHGFKRLSDLFRADDHFRVEDRGGHLYVKRVR